MFTLIAHRYTWTGLSQDGWTQPHMQQQQQQSAAVVLHPQPVWTAQYSGVAEHLVSIMDGTSLS